ILDLVKSIHGEGDAPARVGASFPMHWEFDYYRDSQKLPWLQTAEFNRSEGFDYYVLREGDRHFIADLGLHEIYRSDLRGTSLGVAKRPANIPALERFSWGSFKPVAYVLFAGALFFVMSLLSGNALLRVLGARLDRAETIFLGFVLGSGVLALMMYAL